MFTGTRPRSECRSGMNSSNAPSVSDPRHAKGGVPSRNITAAIAVTATSTGNT
jgi:hypothetical protein